MWLRWARDASAPPDALLGKPVEDVGRYGDPQEEQRPHPARGEVVVMEEAPPFVAGDVPAVLRVVDISYCPTVECQAA